MFNFIWFGLRVIRQIFWFILWLFCLKYIYPNSLVFSLYKLTLIPYESVNYDFNYRWISRASLGGSLFLSFFHFYLIYQQIYGWPKLIFDLDKILKNIQHYFVFKFLKCSKYTIIDWDEIDLNSFIPDSPSCVYNFVLFSDLWRYILLFFEKKLIIEFLFTYMICIYYLFIYNELN